jgi:hypothetical protein
MPAEEPTGLYDVYPRFDRRTRRKGRNLIGPLRKGKLTSLGYKTTAKATSRHRAIDRAVKRYGKLSTLRKLNAVRVYTRRTSPKKSKTFKSDVRYVQKKYY